MYMCEVEKISHLHTRCKSTLGEANALGDVCESVQVAMPAANTSSLVLDTYMYLISQSQLSLLRLQGVHRAGTGFPQSGD